MKVEKPAEEAVREIKISSAVSQACKNAYYAEPRDSMRFWPNIAEATVKAWLAEHGEMITPEMIRKGVSEFLRYDGRSEPEDAAVVRIFKAMMRTAGAETHLAPEAEEALVAYDTEPETAET